MTSFQACHTTGSTAKLQTGIVIGHVIHLHVDLKCVVQVPPPSLGTDMAQLLESGTAADVKFKVEEEDLPAHKFILTARSPVFRFAPSLSDVSKVAYPQTFCQITRADWLQELFSKTCCNGLPAALMDCLRPAFGVQSAPTSLTT